MEQLMSSPLTAIIILVTVVVSLMAFNNPTLKSELLFWPAKMGESKDWFRFISYGLIHADFLHLAFNMIALLSFGGLVELVYKSQLPDFWMTKYLVLYVGGLIFATVPDYFKHKDHYGYMALGASGAVSSVLMASIIYFPTMKVGMIFIPFVTIPAYIFGFVYMAFSSYLAQRGSNDNIGHSAHFFGGLFGLLFTIVTDFDALPRFLSQIIG